MSELFNTAPANNLVRRTSFLAGAAAIAAFAVPYAAFAQTPPATRDQVLRLPEAEPRPIATDEAGRYRLDVAGGRITRVEIVGGNETQRAFVRRAFGTVGPDRPLDDATLRHSLALARSYGFWGIEPQLRTSGGVSVLVLTITPPKPWVYASAQNLSAETVGRWSAGATLGFSGLTPLNESTQIGVFHGLADDRQQGIQLSTDALVSDGGLGVHADVSWFRQKPDEKPPNADTVGTTRLARIELDHPIALAGADLARWHVGAEAIDQDTRLASGPDTQRDRLRVAYAGVDLESHKGPTLIEAQITIRQGLDGLGATDKGQPLASRPQGNPKATVLRASARVVRTLESGREIEARARGQWTADPVLAFEEFNYGGFEGGRGLDPGALQGDRGIAAAIEFRGKSRNFLGGSFRPFVFAEAAQTWNEDSFGARHGSALFGGGGLKIALKDRLTVEAAYAVPLADVRGAPAGFSGPRFLITITKGFGG